MILKRDIVMLDLLQRYIHLHSCKGHRSFITAKLTEGDKEVSVNLSCSPAMWGWPAACISIPLGTFVPDCMDATNASSPAVIVLAPAIHNSNVPCFLLPCVKQSGSARQSLLNALKRGPAVQQLPVIGWQEHEFRLDMPTLTARAAFKGKKEELVEKLKSVQRQHGLWADVHAVHEMWGAVVDGTEDNAPPWVKLLTRAGV